MTGDYPDFQRVANWIGAPLDTANALAVGVGGVTRGPFTITNWASVIIIIKATTNPCSVGLLWSNSGAPASLSISEGFTPAVATVGQSTFNVLGDTLTVVLTGIGGTATVDYAVIPANTVVGSNFLSACILSEATLHSASAAGALVWEDPNGNICQRLFGNRTPLATGSELELETWTDAPGSQNGRLTVVVRDSTGAVVVSRKLLAGDGTSDYALASAIGVNAGAAFAPGTPAGIVNSTLERHYGLGATCVLTPTNTGKVRVHATGIGGPGSSVYRLRHGTGAAPANNALATGTADGPQVPFGINAVALHWVITGLAVGTQVWFDVTAANNGSQTSSLGTPVLTMTEF